MITYTGKKRDVQIWQNGQELALAMVDDNALAQKVCNRINALLRAYANRELTYDKDRTSRYRSKVKLLKNIGRLSIAIVNAKSAGLTQTVDTLQQEFDETYKTLVDMGAFKA